MTTIDLAKYYAIGMYVGEPCRVCGKPIKSIDIGQAVFAGYSDCGRSRASHGLCWANRHKDKWAFPDEFDK